MCALPCRIFAVALLCAALPFAGYAQNPSFDAFTFRASGGGTGVGPGATALNFLIEEGKAQTVLLRVAGPSLTTFQIAGALSDPALTVYDGRGVRVAGNDDWGGTNELSTAFRTVGAFPFLAGSRDAALLFEAPPGMYTAAVSGADAMTGVVLLELYKYQPLSSRIPYAAARASAGPGPNILIAGVFVGPPNLTNLATVIVRGVGPALAERGITGTLADPVISLSPRPQVANDNWPVDLASRMTTAGLLPLTAGSLDAALLTQVATGSYTLELGSANARLNIGIGMLEIANTDFRMTTIAPALLVPPYPVAGVVGGNVTLSAIAAGRPAPTFQWRKNGIALEGATAPSLQLAALRATDAGDYSVVLSNTGGTVTSAPFVVSLAQPPTITAQPASLTVGAGSSASFTVSASGSTSFTYQWLRDGVALAGATAQTLQLPNVQPASAGAYTVRVSNTLGSVTSAAATLTVLLRPAITSSPVSLTVAVGAPASFSVTATGSPPLAYQWRRNETNIPGATSATFAIPFTRLSDAGNYDCVVSNAVGAATSATARLTFEPTLAGTYFGTFSQTAGGWALVVQPDGIATFLAFINNPRSGILFTFRVGANGTLSATGPLIQSTTAGPVRTVTLAASIDSSNRVTGTLQGLNLTLGGAREGSGGETAAFAGMYQATGPDNWFAYLIVGSSRQAMALFIHGTARAGPTAPMVSARPVAALDPGAPPPDGGLGQVGTDGTVDVTTPNGGRLFGRVMPDGFAGTVSEPPEPAVNVRGPETDGLGAPVLVTSPAEQSVVIGSPAMFAVVAGGATPLSYQWKKDGTAIAGATGATYAIAVAQRSDAGSYTCEVMNPEDRVTSPAARFSVTAPGPARLVNLSVRTELESASDNFRLGFVVAGAGGAPPKPLVIRVAGPSLTAFGATGVAADPRLQLFVGPSVVAENDDWGGSPDLAAAMSRVGAFPYSASASKDAALVANITERDNTVAASATGPGTVIAELYDASTDTDGRRLRNVSVLKSVGSGLIAGFVINGTGTKRVLVRAVGPTLASAFNLGGALADPQMTLSQNGVAIRTNDNWEGAELQAAFRTGGAFELPAGSRDAAIVASLGDGEYTAQVTGVNNAGGVCLIEIYDLDP